MVKRDESSTGREQPEPAKRRLRSVVGHLLFVLVIVWGVVLTLEIRDRLGWSEPDADPGAGFWSEQEAASGAGQDEGSLADFLRDPGGLVGLEALDGDPLDLAPPEGAERIWAGRRARGEQAVLSATYHYRGAIPEAKAHYRRALQAARLRVLLPAPDPRGGTVLPFVGVAARGYVTLRKRPVDEKMVTIVVNVLLKSEQP